MSTIDVTSNIGKSWTADEEAQLIQEFSIDKLNIPEIAFIHKRKYGGIRSRLIQLGLISVSPNRTTSIMNVMETNSNNNHYKKIINEYNNKEKDLTAKIKFLKENKEQLIRIKLLEAELQNLENQIQLESTIQIQKIEKNKQEEEYNQICIDNCKDAFQLYKLNLRSMRKNSHSVQINSTCLKYYINYSFELRKDNLYKVNTNIPNFPGLYDKKVYGIYSEEKGLVITV